MKDFIFIAGAPGAGKSTIANFLQRRLNSPMFEFGWIPEFQNKGETSITYTEEEEFSFENLILVAKNYAKHDFKNVIITDLNNKFIEKLPEIFDGYDFAIYTLRLDDENMLKQRVLDESRSSGYRNWEEAQEINQSLMNRQPFKNETFISIDSKTAEQVTEQILESLKNPSSASKVIE